MYFEECKEEIFTFFELIILYYTNNYLNKIIDIQTLAKDRKHKQK